MIVSEITLFNTLKTKLGENEAQAVVEGIKNAVKEEFETKKDVMASKSDLAKVETGIIKWMFISWIGQLASFIAIAKFFFHQ